MPSLVASNVYNKANPHQSGAMVPISLTSSWQNVTVAGGPATQDNAGTVVNPETEIGTSKHRFFRRGTGTHALVCLAYSAAATPSTDPVVSLFGRTGTDAWRLLKNVNGGTSAAITTSAADSSDGTLKYTIVDPSLQAFDCLGCEELILAVLTAFAVSAGSTAGSFLQIKMI